MGVFEDMNKVFLLPGKRKLEISEEDVLKIFKGQRPENMSKEDFKFISWSINREVKDHMKGKIVHLSKFHDNYWKQLAGDKSIKHRQRGNTYKKENDEQQ